MIRVRHNRREIKETVLFRDLMAIKSKIPYPTYRTIIGQIKAGDIEGAAVGVYRLKKRIARMEAQNENSYC